MKPRGLCRLIGHRIDYEALNAQCYTLCTRCGDDDFYNMEYERSWTDCIRFRWWVKLRSYLSFMWRTKAIKCRDCGGRFGRHSDDCLPF